MSTFACSRLCCCGSTQNVEPRTGGCKPETTTSSDPRSSSSITSEGTSKNLIGTAVTAGDEHIPFRLSLGSKLCCAPSPLLKTHAARACQAPFRLSSLAHRFFFGRARSRSFPLIECHNIASFDLGGLIGILLFRHHNMWSMQSPRSQKRHNSKSRQEPRLMHQATYDD